MLLSSGYYLFYYFFSGDRFIMAYIGIGYTGDDTTFLREQVHKHSDWLKGDRSPHFFGDGFLVLYDSNTAREFIRKCRDDAPQNQISVYQLGRPLEK
jgi:hypothetical protein